MFGAAGSQVEEDVRDECFESRGESFGGPQYADVGEGCLEDMYPFGCGPSGSGGGR
jgi:hypothetical protein